MNELSRVGLRTKSVACWRLPCPGEGGGL